MAYFCGKTKSPRVGFDLATFEIKAETTTIEPF
jgi:hypothetical protein